ncbi:MAG: leucine-rich repeat domain-containing protein [Treponema sp.]|nr:leucine-rich repeat domain-containing protein [Treponema sp.]
MFRRDVRNSWISACPRLRHVKWPGRLSSIGDFCFMDTNISTVDLRGTRIRVLGVCAFCNCKGLTSLRVPETLESIGASCFARTELHSVNLRHCRNLREISIWAFKGCRS